MAFMTKEMEAQRIAFVNANERYANDPTDANWRDLETEMWAWHKMKFPGICPHNAGGRSLSHAV